MEFLVPEIDGVPIGWLKVRTREEAHEFYIRQQPKLPKELMKMQADRDFDKLMMYKLQLRRNNNPLYYFLSR